MAKTNIKLIHLLAIILILTGTGSLLIGVWPVLNAQLTGQGSVITDTGYEVTEDGFLREAAPVPGMQVSGTHILVGLALFLLGFALHSYIVIYRNPVRERGGKRKKKDGSVEYFWMKIWP